MLGRTDRRGRLTLLLVIFIVLAVALGARLAYWQLSRGEELRTMALHRIALPVEQAGLRGDIVDRRGTVLATTSYRDLLAVHADQLPPARRATVARELARILGYQGETANRLEQTVERGDSYAVIARELTEEQSEAVRQGVADGKLSAVSLDPRPVRFYPNPGGAPETTLASHLLGFVNGEGRGQYGVEQRYQDLLAGRPKLVLGGSDGTGGRVVDEGTPGGDLQLTIDASLQLLLEKELYAAWVADKASRVSAVVVHPDTGDVLASASVPAYDANDYAAIAARSPDSFVDPILGEVYEPGSVMKMLVAAAGYETGAVTPRTPIVDAASVRLGRSRVDNADKRGMGTIPFEDVIAYSRNVGTSLVAMRLGRNVHEAATVLHGMWRRLGIGTRTGVDLTGELPGLVADPRVKRWTSIDLANRAFGQGVAVTQLQLARAFAVMVNGGRLVRPRVVAAIDGVATEASPAPRVIRPQLSAALRRLMARAASTIPRIARGTLIPGYAVGGKTGTAQIWDPKRGDWVPKTFNFSFVGYVGQSKPEAVIAVQIHRTKPQILGQGRLQLSITSYELFRRIAVDAIDVLAIPSSDSLPPSEARDDATAVGQGRSPRADAALVTGDHVASVDRAPPAAP